MIQHISRRSFLAQSTLALACAPALAAAADAPAWKAGIAKAVITPEKPV